MKLRFLLLLLATALPLACDRSADRSDTGGDAPAAAATRTPEAAISAAEQVSAAGEPDTAGAQSDRPALETPAPGGPAAVQGAVAQPATGAPGDSATRILERAAARYAALNSLQADFAMTYENPLLRSRSNGSGTLYQKRPDRLLLRFSEPAGDVILSDGRYFWVYYPSVDAAQVLRTQASPDASAGVDLQAQFLGDPTRRFSYALEGEEAVNGRPAWRLTLKPRESLGYRELRVWIDQRDDLAHRFEITEENGSIRRFELRNPRLNGALPDALFQFDVPAGARVVTR
ncbi:MAG: outer membrane lipoprotein carrier protein LolA [Gemmatimonadetes bacterium]|nr:outer membrane lipoprotein carrier protein LolA [Gemmatimonadota bacterium]